MNTDAADTKTLCRISKVGDWLALVCLAAMVSVPLLHPRHYNPIPSFWSEFMFQRPRQYPIADMCSPLQFKHAREFIERRAGGHHIVNDHD